MSPVQAGQGEPQKSAGSDKDLADFFCFAMQNLYKYNKPKIYPKRRGNINYFNNYYNNSSCYTETFAGNDAIFGNIYYRADCGYYAYYGNNVRYLGYDFKFTEYVGRDSCGREIYFRSEYGYIRYSGNGNTWYKLGYNINNVL